MEGNYDGKSPTQADITYARKIDAQVDELLQNLRGILVCEYGAYPDEKADTWIKDTLHTFTKNIIVTSGGSFLAWKKTAE